MSSRQRAGRAELDVHLDVHTCERSAQDQQFQMVAIASPAARAKARGPRRQVQRSDHVEAAAVTRQQKRTQKTAIGASKARVAGEADKQSRGYRVGGFDCMGHAR